MHRALGISDCYLSLAQLRCASDQSHHIEKTWRRSQLRPHQRKHDGGAFQLIIDGVFVAPGLTSGLRRFADQIAVYIIFELIVFVF